MSKWRYLLHIAYRRLWLYMSIGVCRADMWTTSPRYITIYLRRRLWLPAILFFHHGGTFWGKSAMFRNVRCYSFLFWLAKQNGYCYTLIPYTSNSVQWLSCITPLGCDTSIWGLPLYCQLSIITTEPRWMNKYHELNVSPNTMSCQLILVTSARNMLVAGHAQPLACLSTQSNFSWFSPTYRPSCKLTTTYIYRTTGYVSG